MTAAATALSALLVAASKSSSSSSSSVTFIIFLVVIGLVGYFLLLRPQQQKARRQRQQQSEISVGDEILTVGGIVGTVLEIDDQRVTIVTGIDHDGQPGGPGAQPARLVLLRSAIARKVEPTGMPDATGPGGAAGTGDSAGDREWTDGGSGEGGAP